MAKKAREFVFYQGHWKRGQAGKFITITPNATIGISDELAASIDIKETGGCRIGYCAVTKELLLQPCSRQQPGAMAWSCKAVPGRAFRLDGHSALRQFGLLPTEPVVTRYRAAWEAAAIVVDLEDVLDVTPQRRGPGQSARAADVQGDPLDADGDDGNPTDDDEVEPNEPGPSPSPKPPKCEWCDHRDGAGICGAVRSPLYGIRVAVGGTCSEYTARRPNRGESPPPKKTPVWVGKTDCPACGKEVAYREVEGKKVLRRHKDPDGQRCDGAAS